MKYIQAIVPEEIHRLFETHPLRWRKNQRPCAGEMIQRYLESPEGQIPLLKEKITDLVQRVEWMSQRLERFEARVKELENQISAASLKAAS